MIEVCSLNFKSLEGHLVMYVNLKDNFLVPFLVISTPALLVQEETAEVKQLIIFLTTLADQKTFKN